MRYLTGIVILIAAGMGCSRSNDRPVAASPTSPSAIVAESTITFVGGVSGPMDVLFPGRNDSLVFRIALENKYRDSLRRTAAASVVDVEGDVVWTQEYMRYRVNGCDHTTALQRVMAQIDGAAPGGICGAPPEGVVLFPPRTDSLLFRIALEARYQQMNRGTSPTFVDPEGAVIWTQEYLRYRANGCDHASAQDKVFSQIDGGPVPDVCVLPCSLTVPAGIDISADPMTGSFQVRPNRAGCNIGWTATSDASWLTFPAGQSPGVGFTDFSFAVSQNSGNTRTGRITISWAGGSATFQVTQSGTPFVVGFDMRDPFRSGSAATTECHFRSAATPCTLTAYANLPGGGSYTYTWQATYVYGTTKTTTQTGPSQNFTITDACGGPGAASDGPGAELLVTVTITDSLGNVINLQSGQGNQPGLAVRLFTC